jgi:hypothetical protein
MLATANPGEYRSEHPLPLYGEWKTLVRLHEGTNDMMSYPLYMPDDPAISSPRGREIRVTDGERITGQYEPLMLQRERKDSVPHGLFVVAYCVVLGLWLCILLSFGACYNRAAGPRRAAVSEYDKAMHA